MVLKYIIVDGALCRTSQQTPPRRSPVHEPLSHSVPKSRLKSAHLGQLHSSLKGGSFVQGGMEDVLLPAPLTDADPLLDTAPLLGAAPPLDP